MSWLTPQEIADVCGIGLRSINRLALDGRWREDAALSRRRAGKGGGFEYHVDLLPAELRARLTLAQAPAEERAAIERSAVWERFDTLPDKHKAEASRRLDILAAAELLEAGGLRSTAAAKQAARDAGVAASSVFAWRKAVHKHKRADWLPALAPAWSNGGTLCDVHEDAWRFLKSDFLRFEEPTFSSCYRRMADLAAAKGWSPIPSEQAARRRLDAEVPSAVQIAARDGKDAAKALYPAQRRTVGHLTAMQYANIDGHKFDVTVERDGKIFRPCMIMLQDIYSRKVLAWRLSDSENKETTRLVIGDMVERFGIPERLYSDNGRAFASKWISGKSKTRFRFKIRDEDPEGLLTALGVAVSWTTPYSGQSKPIERAFKDLADTISRHPACSGAWTGNHIDNKPDNHGERAIPFDEFRELVDVEIARHNARPGRQTETANGRSFDQTFEASLETAIVTRATPQQAALWMLAAERVRADRTRGMIELLGTRYWNEALTAHAGKQLTVRFDPDNLARAVRVYDAANRLICAAEPFGDVRFDDAEQARQHNKLRRSYQNNLNEQARLHAELSAAELGALMAETRDPAEKRPVRPAAIRLATGGAKPKPQEEAWNEADEAAFGRGILRVIEGGREDD